MVFSVLFAVPAASAERICVVPFTGPGGPSVRNQLISTLCDAADCVAPAKAVTANKPDWKKAKQQSISYFVTGFIAKKGKASTLTLQVLQKSGGKPRFAKSFALENGELSTHTVAAATSALRDAFAAQTGDPAPDKPPAAERTSTPAPKPVEPVASKPPEGAAEPAKPAEETHPTGTSEGPPAEPPPTRRQPFIAAELGASPLSRSYSYVAATTSNLRKYDVFTTAAMARIELYPLALTSTGLIGGLGVEGQFSIATWIKSAVNNSPGSYPTAMMKLDAGLLWKIRPSSTFDLAFYPIVGIRLHRFTVNAAADGSRLDGLPNLNYFGVRAGLGIDVPLANNLLVIFARVVAIPVFSSGEVISAAYFKAGSNFGLEGNAGLGIRIVTHVSVRLAFDFTRYSLTFKTDSTDVHIAAGAVDQYLGGTASVRFEY
jgi:hypothetical protein